MKEIVMGKKMLMPQQVVRIEELLGEKDEWGRGRWTQEEIARVVMCSPATVGRIARRSAAYADGPGNLKVQLERGVRLAEVTPDFPREVTDAHLEKMLKNIEANKPKPPSQQMARMLGLDALEGGGEEEGEAEGTLDRLQRENTLNDEGKSDGRE